MAAGRRWWERFTIRTDRDPAAADARRVVFELRDAPGAHPATVVLRAGGELLVRFELPSPAVPGIGRNDFIRKAVAVVQDLPGE